MEQSIAVDSSIDQTFVYENDNEKTPHTVYLTFEHNKYVDFMQLVLTFSHSFNDTTSFAVPIGIPLFDQQHNFTGTQTDSLWHCEVAVLSDVYMRKGKQLFTFTSDEGRIFNGLKTVGIRIEK